MKEHSIQNQHQIHSRPKNNKYRFRKPLEPIFQNSFQTSLHNQMSPFLSTEVSHNTTHKEKPVVLPLKELKEKKHLSKLGRLSNIFKQTTEKLQESEEQRKKSSHKRTAGQNLYIQEVESILDKGSELLHANQRQLKNINDTSRYLRTRYGKLKKNSELIVAGIEEYKLEEDLKKRYKQQFEESWVRPPK